MKKLNIILLLVTLFLNNCAILKNTPQQSKYMKVSGGGFVMKDGEPKYGMVIDFKYLPDNAKYLIAEFEVPSSPGKYEKKVFELSKNQGIIAVNSNPIYGYEFGLYYIKAYLSSDKDGKNILDSLIQSIKLYKSFYNGRDYAIQNSIKKGENYSERIVTIYPHNRKNLLIEGVIPNGFKMGYAAVSHDSSVTEYIPNNENITNWSKIITIREEKPLNLQNNKPHVFSLVVANGLYKKFSEKDKDIQITYAAQHNGNFINTETPNFNELAKESLEVAAYIDYADFERIKKNPNEREYLVLKSMKSDISIWQIQYTIRYNKKLPKEQIESLKKEVRELINSFKYANKSAIDEIKDNGFIIESERLDNKEFNQKFKDL